MSSFVDNPLVTQDPSIRFCVIDMKPRQLTPFQFEALEILRGAVISQIELRRAQLDIQHLKSIVPMCAWCEKIRIEQGASEKWLSLNEFVLIAELEWKLKSNSSIQSSPCLF